VSSGPAADKRWVTWLLAVLAAAGFATGLVLASPLIPDLDALYHIGHALVYLERGLFYGEFPWVSASIIADKGGDLWYGFHVLLVPIVGFQPDAALAVPWAKGFVLFLGYLALTWGFEEAEIPAPWLWPSLVFTATLFSPWRAVMTRPGILSLGLLIVVVAATARGRWKSAAAAGFLFAFVHLTTSWLIPVALLVLLAAQVFTKRGVEWRTAGAVVAAALVGAFARPLPFSTMALLKVQIIDVGRLVDYRPKLRFGAEVAQPIAWETMRTIATPLMILFGVAVLVGLWAWRKGKLREPALWFTVAALAVAFFALTTLKSARTVELWSAATVALLALTWRDTRPDRHLAGWTAASVLLLGGLAAFQLPRGIGYIERFGRSVDSGRAAAEWLAANAEPNAVVFHAHWEDFPSYFAYNRKQRWIGGMDPVFEFRHDETKYWIAHWLCSDRATDQVALTPQGYDGPTEPMAESLHRRFNADYLVVPAGRMPKLMQYLDGRPEFRNEGVFNNVAVYRILVP